MSAQRSDSARLKDVEEGDVVPSTLEFVPKTFRPRVKALSDMAGMELALPAVTHPRRRADRRSVSDIAALLNLPLEAAKETVYRRTRQSSDVLVKFGQAPALRQDDLRLAEHVAAFGPIADRKENGVDEDETMKLIEGDDQEKFFKFNKTGLTSEEASEALAIYGKNELPEKIEPKWLLFLRQFWAPMPIMIWIAIIVEAAISNFLDMGFLLLIQFTNASISFYELNKAGNAVAALKSSLKPQATCKRDGKWSVMDATLLVPNDLVLLGSGSTIPADCRVNGSEIDVDQAALTGESLPVTFYKGDAVKMGSTVVRGEVEATVEFTGANTFFGKTASLLEDKHEVSHLQQVLMRIMMVLVALSLLLSGIYFAFLLISGVDLKEALSYTVVILVASIPLAIEIVTNTTLAIGSKNLVKHGAIVAKLSAIEDMAGMAILCSDKTGTLTLNQMMLQEDTPIYLENETQESVLMYGAMAAKWKEPPRDALDRLILGNVNMDLLENFQQSGYLPFDPQIKRTEGTVKDMTTGEVFKTSKGAPHIILGLLGSDQEGIQNLVEKDVARLGEKGVRSLAIARTMPGSGEWRMVGLLTFLDPPRPDTKATIAGANKHGVEVKMITGDHLLIAANTAQMLDMGDRIFTADRLPLLDPETKEKPKDLGKIYGDLCLAANGFAQVYPEHKYLIVECLRELGYTVGMTGDGVNDAPALKRADVGVAVAGATDAARAAADIILTQEGLGTIVHGIIIAREIFQRISNFITYRIAATLQILVFFFISIFVFHPSDYQQPKDPAEGLEWPEFFYMPVIMLMLITLLNDGTLITIAYDNAKASESPNKWNLPALFLASSVLGVLSCVSSLVLLHFLLDSWNPNGFFQKVGIEGVQYGQVITAIYLKISVSDFLTLFSARTGDKFFWQIRPANMLFYGGCFALSLSSILALFWPQTEIENILVEGLRSDLGVFAFVWIYSIFFFLLQDVFKVGAYIWMYRTNFCGVANTGVVVLPDSTKKLITDLETAMKEEGIAHVGSKSH
ncbi:plasma-membrane proton-efflux P-type ATPase [Nitzschia inconspicua]|uniref:Plasma membrane ATPase n=1 Tax=Nitzschia inconspicua TaxID=303405 RepID=A0A9K3LHS4_9STRA|nr:plasma-membrane proton-efflux P-type ATPase [Nitzschia inconspicua]KAG7362327.1 plasma-membrane proton-efflux P-type ATPase [Nitzschia inconspicua]KAG7365596.1 plasma-membrane proton-efflux P-type ATPase [Nitzschia inconspicua]